MKITFKITYDELVVINDNWGFLNTYNINSRESKVVFSVLSDLAEKFQKKTIGLKDPKKTFSIKLKYYEAHYLEKFLIKIRLENDFSDNVQRRIIYELNQKLA